MPLSRGRGVVMFEDGTERRFETSINAIAEYERYAIRNGLPMGADAAPITLALFTAYYALSENGEGFDAWRSRVVALETEPGQVPPTPPEPSTE
jgi:hypothetical protein